MQLSIEIPEQLGFELKTVINPNEFIIHALQKALEENKKEANLKLQALRTALIDGEQSGDDGELNMEQIRREAKQEASLM